MAAGAAVVVVALQEIEVGGGSVAMAAAKDVLMMRQQVGPGSLNTHLVAVPAELVGCCSLMLSTSSQPATVTRAAGAGQ